MNVAIDQNIEELIKLEVASQLADIKEKVPQDKVSIICFSGDFDKAMAGFMLATGAAAMGMQVTMFFTYWGMSLIKKGKKLSGKKDFLQKMVNFMLPGSSKKLAPSKMAFGPIGGKLFRHMMKKKNIASLEDLIEMAVESGVKFVACTPTMEIMGIGEDEFIVPVEIGGVARYYEDALNSRTTLFI